MRPAALTLVVAAVVARPAPSNAQATAARPWPGLFAAQAVTPDLWPLVGSAPTSSTNASGSQGFALSTAGSVRLGSVACDASGTPDIAACAGLAVSEVGALRKLACLLDAFNRWRLQVIACAQAQIDAWQDAVIWPQSGLHDIGVTLRRVRTLREEVEGSLTGWPLRAQAQTWAALAATPQHANRGLYESVWGPSLGAGRDTQDLVAWHSALARDAVQARTNGAFGEAGEIPESTWERIGREGARQIGDERRDALSALRLTPQLAADRVRVEVNTVRLQAHTLTALQIRRDARRLRRVREWSLGNLWLRVLVEPTTKGQ